MAKKKNKKNIQKQVDVAAPPESPKPTAAPAIEEPPAGERAQEAQEQSIAPPPEKASDELPVTDSTSMPEGTPGDAQDKPGKDKAPILGGNSTIDEATTSSQSDHVAADPVASNEMVTGKAVVLPEQIPAEEDTQASSLDQPSVTEMAEEPQAEPGSSENTTAHMGAHNVQDPSVPADSETVLEGEVQVGSQEKPVPMTHAEDPVPVGVQASTVLGALAEAQQHQDKERSHAEVDVAINPIEEVSTVESPSAAEPTKVESEQIDQQDRPSESTTHHAPQNNALPPVLTQEPPTVLSKEVVPASPSLESSQLEDTNEPPLTATKQSAPVETVSPLGAPTQDVNSPLLPSDTLSVAAEEAPQENSLPAPASEQISQRDPPPPPTQEAGTSDDPPSFAIPEPPTEEQTQAIVEPESADWVVPPSKKETSKQRRKREAEERRQREEQEELEQKEFEQYRIDQERMEMARLEQKRLEREKARQERRAKEQAEQHRLERERAEQERLEKARLEQERLEKERLEQERLEKERLEQERLEQERLEKARQDQERLELEKLDRERLERERIEQKRLEDMRVEEERVEKERIEQEKIQQATQEQERLDAERRVEDRIEKERLERQRIEHEAMEQKKRQQEAEATARAAKLARKERLEAEADAEDARLKQEQEASPTSAGNTAREADSIHSAHTSVQEVSRSTLSPVPHKEAVPEVVAEPLHLSTPPPEAVPEPPTASSVRPNNPGNRLPTPAASVGHSSSPHSVAADAPKPRANETDPLPPPFPDNDSHNRVTSDSSALPAPKPQAVSQIIQESRPPAPSPPVTRARPRHVPAFDSEDESDSALVRPRRQFRGGEDYTRDGSSGSQGYPPQTTHRFASRVPPEPSHANAPPPPQPPGYHPGYYPPAAPPHYQNHNYRMSQQGYSHPNPYGPPSHSSASPYTEQWNYPSGYRHDSPPQRHDTLVARDYPLGLAPIDTRSAIGDDPGDVFSRIAQTIPDLHVLLARYKETHSQLSVREELLRRSGLEQEEKLRAKDDEIADLRERTRNLEHRYSTEASRLRLQIGNLEEQARDLQEQRRETERYRKEAQDTKAALDAAMKSWESRYKELEEAHAALVEEKAKADQDFDEWKSTYTTRNDAEKIALAIQFDQRLKEASVLAENQKQEATEAYVREKEELRADHQRQQLERQASFDRVRNELETKLGTAQIDREEALKHERESREVWLAEREALIKSHQDDRESIRKGWDEQRDLLEAQYRKSKDESDKAWLELHADATRKADEQKAQVDQLIQEKEELHKKYNALRAESEQEKAIIKSVATNLESEKSRLEKLMECYGDIAEIKSKGDTYYSVSFSQLQKQIIDLATTHFVHLPVRPPAEDLAQVPSNLPSFLGDTVASRQVRAAYIAHTVSKLITYRVFGPFLFSLGRRYDKADSLFLSMSHHIRDKSTRKEAIWRQQTLLAAFTSSGAKQRINTAAGTVVEEIVSAIKHFADPREEEGIKIAVKRIVKLAAETWRFARLEREMINATMPALLDEEHQFTGPEYWPSYDSYKPEGTLIGSLAGTSPPSDEQPQLLLRLFPVIWRESKHENFHVDGEKPDEGCIYHHGLALYDDAEPVVQRLEELKSAGLPTHTITVSPTIAESGKFPPPIVPPPREALPHPPATAERSDRSTTVSTPHSPTEFLDTSTSRHTTPPPPPSSIPSLSEPSPKPVSAYKRPAPGPIEFASPRNLIGMPPPVESMAASIPPYSRKTSDAPSASKRSEPAIPEATAQKVEGSEAAIAPPHRSPPPPPAVGPVVEPPHLAPDESGVLPHFPEPSPSESKSRDPPTPPHSRSATPTERPVSPLFEAIDEIEALETHRSRKPSTSISRRKSTHKRRSKELKEEMPDVTPTTERPDTSRRTSGYALSARSMKTVDTERTERTDRTEKTEKTERSERTDRTDKTERDPKSRYMCESRSAAVKALYPNSPMAGQSTSNSSSKNSISSSKKKDRDSRELKREKSIADNSTWIPENGTWDTSSNRTSEGTNTQFSTC